MRKPGDIWVEREGLVGSWWVWACLPNYYGQHCDQIVDGPWDDQKGAVEKMTRMIAWSDARATQA